jgi:hypothetical protein
LANIQSVLLPCQEIDVAALAQDTHPWLERLQGADPDEVIAVDAAHFPTIHWANEAGTSA